MAIIELHGHCVVISPQLRQAVDFVDPRVMPDFESAAADFVMHSFVPGSVNTDEVDITPIIHNLYELFAGSFVTCALHRRISESDRAAQLATFIQRLVFSSYINPKDGMYNVVLDIGVAPNFTQKDTLTDFCNQKYLHELSLSSVN